MYDHAYASTLSELSRSLSSIAFMRAFLAGFPNSARLYRKDIKIGEMVFAESHWTGLRACGLSLIGRPRHARHHLSRISGDGGDDSTHRCSTRLDRRPRRNSFNLKNLVTRKGMTSLSSLARLLGPPTLARRQQHSGGGGAVHPFVAL